MKRVLTALVLIPLVLLAVFKAHAWLFTLLVGVVALLALKEYMDLVEAYRLKPIRWLGYVCVAVGFLATAFNQGESGVPYLFFIRFFAGLVLVLPFFFLMVAMMREDLSQAFPAATASCFGVFYVGLPMVAVASLRGPFWFPVVFTFVAVWSGDIVAMYTGKTIGRHKMTPRVSPNKTWEGAFGSVAGSVLFCWLLTHFASAIQHMVYGHPGYVLYSTMPSDQIPELGILRPTTTILVAILLNVAAQLGDLVESLIKRGANVKDSGTMLPGHGGILDRIDALLFAAPVALILFELVR